MAVMIVLKVLILYVIMLYYDVSKYMYAPQNVENISMLLYYKGSDEDDETIAGYHEPILEAKDPYALRPMPYLIGTSGFFESDDVGIGDFESEGVFVWITGCVSVFLYMCVHVCLICLPFLCVGVVCMYMNVYVLVHVYVPVYVFVCLCVYICLCVYVLICTYVSVCVCVCVCVYICTYVYSHSMHNYVVAISFITGT